MPILIKKIKPILTIIMALAVFLPAATHAQSQPQALLSEAKLTAFQDGPASAPFLAPKTDTEESEPVSCNYAAPEKTKFSGRFLGVRRKTFVEPGEVFIMQVYIQNISTVPWFSASSGCANEPIVSLGTAKDRDRPSPFFNDLPGAQNSWRAPNRIAMTNKRVSPHDVAVFEILAKAPMEPGLYREFFAPVAENIAWIEDEALFSVDIRVGEAQLDQNQKELLAYIQKSANLNKIDFNGNKKIEVHLGAQQMRLKIGDTLVRTMQVSTGAKKTPTPRGEYNIMEKQPVRIASKKPHYIMPFFQMFKNGGFGLHALPSLANDHGVFWTEALNHIGRPVSHGCIRLLPKDAEFVWKFTDVGTKMTVKS